MSLFATVNADQHEAVTTPETDLPGNDPTPSPLASSAEVISTFFPSDAGGVGYLFDHGLLDAAPTPLEDVPVPTPDLGAAAMSAVNEGVDAHVSPMPSVPDPVAGATGLDLSTAEPVATVSSPSLLRTTLANEGSRLRNLFARLGGPTSG